MTNKTFLARFWHHDESLRSQGCWLVRYQILRMSCCCCFPKNIKNKNRKKHFQEILELFVNQFLFSFFLSNLISIPTTNSEKFSFSCLFLFFFFFRILIIDIVFIYVRCLSLYPTSLYLYNYLLMQVYNTYLFFFFCFLTAIC